MKSIFKKINNYDDSLEFSENQPFSFIIGGGGKLQTKTPVRKVVKHKVQSYSNGRWIIRKVICNGNKNN